MDLRLDGKRALVTGSTAGIGYAIAEGLAQEGAEVIVNGRSAERVVEAVGAINHTTSTRAIGIAADLGSADGVTRLVGQPRNIRCVRRAKLRRRGPKSPFIPRDHIERMPQLVS